MLESNTYSTTYAAIQILTIYLWINCKNHRYKYISTVLTTLPIYFLKKGWSITIIDKSTYFSTMYASVQNKYNRLLLKERMKYNNHRDQYKSRRQDVSYCIHSLGYINLDKYTIFKKIMIRLSVKHFHSIEIATIIDPNTTGFF